MQFVQRKLTLNVQIAQCRKLFTRV